MSIQDDHFDLEHYFREQIEKTEKGTPERAAALSARVAYLRVWDAFIETEAENEELRPVANAVTTLVTHVINKHYAKPDEEPEQPQSW